MENNINNNILFDSEKLNDKQDTNHNIYYNFQSDNESETNRDSDSDEYVDLSSNIESASEDIYQFAVSEDKLELKHIGKFTKAPDIIINEKFGPESNMSLYSCVYTHGELTIKSDELFFPLVKLIVDSESKVVITCIAIKLTKPIQIDKPIEEWELYWLENKSDLEHIKMCKIEKNINPTNIIEKLIGYSVNN
jgi:hypothetical protein